MTTTDITYLLQGPSTDYEVGYGSGYYDGCNDGEAEGWREGYSEAVADVRRKLDSAAHLGFVSLTIEQVNGLLGEALTDREVAA